MFGTAATADLSALPRGETHEDRLTKRRSEWASRKWTCARASEVETEVFALIELLAEASRLVVSFSVNGELKDAREVDIAAAGTTPVVFDATAAGPGIASVSIDSKDALLADNQAWAQIDPPRTVRVLVTGKANPWLDLVLKSSGGMSHRRITEEEYARKKEELLRTF